MKELLNMIYLSSYIQQWRLAIWETCFFQEFKPKDGIRRSKSWEQQSKSKEAVKQVLYKYSIMFSFPFNHNTSFCLQSMANYFLNVCWSTQFFLDHHKVSQTLGVEVGKLVAMFVDFIVKALFTPLQVFLSCLVIPRCH